MRKIISGLFYILFFLTPLAVYPYTSELFEFNKIIVLYFLTTLIITCWAVEMVVEKRFVFKKTILDTPLLIFLGTQGISTILSLDLRTSLLGYYLRFNGGLASSICYALLYWAWVTNMDAKKTRIVSYVLLSASFFVSIYAIAQHFGIDRDLWVQDVQNRVFSTLGQPNWLAAWVVAIMPITWTLAIGIKQKTINKCSWIGLSLVFFITLLFTKSRSGLLGFGIAFILFWSVSLFNKSRPFQTKFFLILCSLFFVVCTIVGTPWTSPLFAAHNQPTTNNQLPPTTSLESGGTDSGVIRKIVWKGAIEIWKSYPIFGTGVETFAFAYYQFKPPEHNYTSEWDYLYNKAHNEYLNLLATTGIVGFGAYLVLIGCILYQLRVQSAKSDNNFALLSGFIGILVTNFFGFSVVPISLLFFLFPAFTVSLSEHSPQPTVHRSLSIYQKSTIFTLLIITSYLLLSIGKYWYADYLYASGHLANRSSNFVVAHQTLTKAVMISPNEAIYLDELAFADRSIAERLSESGKDPEAQEIGRLAIAESQRASSLSPANVNLKRNLASNLTKLSFLDQVYLSQAQTVLKKAVQQAPTDPKLQYALAASFYRLGNLDTAISEMKKAVDMKKDYKDARFALALMYIDAKQPEDAKKEFTYILEKIAPNDEQVKKELEELK